MNLAPSASDLPWDDLPAPRKYELFLTVQPGDLDDLNHVNNTVYLVWCEQVARQHAQSLNMGTEALLALGAVPVAREHLIRYLKPALLHDQVRVRTALTFSEGLRSTRAYTIDRMSTSGAAPERLAECRTEWVWIDPRSGRPKRQMAEVRRRFGFD